MKKTTILIIVVLFMVIGYAAYNTTINIYGNGKLAENLSDFKVYLSNLKVNGKEVSGINNTKDEFTINDINGDISVDVINDSTEYDTESYLECVKEDENVGKVWNYDYTGGEQTFVAPVSGTYKLETWGAQGGHGQTTYTGGYGGYSFGIITLNVNTTVYLNVGGSGSEFDGGYNGGGNRTDNHASWRGGSGGGACGNLNDVSNNGGHGGGEKGTVVDSIATSGTQLYSGVNADGKISASFGKGANSTNEGAGGGGFYGGGSGYHNDIGYSGAGGSGYIGNTLLTNKVMYCYNCEESSEESTKTISTTCSEETPTSYCAKKGNGYARITLVSIDS